MYAQVYNSVTEGFAGGTSPAGGMIAGILAILVIVVIQVVIVQFLWNNVLVQAVTVVRPLKSLLATLGLLILIAMIYPGSISASM